MRLPLTPQLNTKDGIVNKNARLTNILVEKRPTGVDIATIRPALTSILLDSGTGRGVVEFSSDLVAIFGGDLHIISENLSIEMISSVEGDIFDFVQSTL